MLHRHIFKVIFSIYEKRITWIRLKVNVNAITAIPHDVHDHSIVITSLTIYRLIPNLSEYFFFKIIFFYSEIMNS